MSGWGARLKKVEQLAQSFHQNPLASPYKPRLWPCQPSSVWRFFPRQNPAISFAQRCKEVVQRRPRQSVPQIFKSQFVRGQNADISFSFDRLSMFLHLKKNSRLRVKGSTWSPPILSCGITTGKYYPYKDTKVSFYGHVRYWMFIFLFCFYYYSSSGRTQSH